MFFRVEYVLRSIDFPRETVLMFAPSHDDDPSLEFHRPTKENPKDLKEDQCLAILQTEQEVSAKIRSQFEFNGTLRPAVNEICGTILERTYDRLRQVVNVMRWRRGDTSHPNHILSARKLEWSDDEKAWSSLSTITSNGIEFGIPSERHSPAIVDSVKEILDGGNIEPIGHELFQEAWSLRTSHPRSALLIGLSAAEVGFKSLIARLSLDAMWLAFNVPSPPLERMLKHYLPTLRAQCQINGSPPFVPETLIEKLKIGINLRNAAAHRGKNIEYERLRATLIAVRDLLYLFDIYAGQKWAIAQVSQETMAAIQKEVEEKKKKSK